MSSQAMTRAASRRGLLLITLAALLWGTIGVATRTIYELTDTNAISIGFFRLAFSVPALAVACWYTLGRTALRIIPADLRWMGLIGVAMATYQVCYFAAIARVGVTVAVLIALCTAPVMVAVLSAMLLHERLTQRILLALGCALVGTTLLVGMPAELEAQHQTLIGALLAFGAALSYSTVTLCSRMLAGRYHPLQPITVGFGIGAIMLLPVALATGLVLSYPLAGWALLLHLGLIPTALGYVLFLAGLRHTPATSASIVTLLEPLTSAVLAWLLFAERLGPLGLIGALLLTGAMLLLFLPARRAVQRAEPVLDS